MSKGFKGNSARHGLNAKGIQNQRSFGSAQSTQSRIGKAVDLELDATKKRYELLKNTSEQRKKIRYEQYKDDKLLFDKISNRRGDYSRPLGLIMTYLNNYPEQASTKPHKIEDKNVWNLLSSPNVSVYKLQSDENFKYFFMRNPIKKETLVLECKYVDDGVEGVWKFDFIVLPSNSDHLDEIQHEVESGGSYTLQPFK